MGSPFEYDAGDAPRRQLLRDCKPGRPSSHDSDIEPLDRQFVQAAHSTPTTPRLDRFSRQLRAPCLRYG